MEKLIRNCLGFQGGVGEITVSGTFFAGHSLILCCFSFCRVSIFLSNPVVPGTVLSAGVIAVVQDITYHNISWSVKETFWKSAELGIIPCTVGYYPLRRKWQDAGRERVVLEKDLCAPGRQRSLYRGKKPGPPAVRFLSHFWVSKSARPSVDLSEEVEMMACPLYKLTAFFCLPSFQHGGIRIAISTATSLARGLETVATAAPAAWTIRTMTPDLDS